MPLEVSVTQLPPACQLCEHIPCQSGGVGTRCLFGCQAGDQTYGPPWSDRPATLMTSSAWEPPPAVLSHHKPPVPAHKFWGREHQAHRVQSMMGNERQHQPGSRPSEPAGKGMFRCVKPDQSQPIKRNRRIFLAPSSSIVQENLRAGDKRRALKWAVAVRSSHHHWLGVLTNCRSEQRCQNTGRPERRGRGTQYIGHYEGGLLRQ